MNATRGHPPQILPDDPNDPRCWIASTPLGVVHGPTLAEAQAALDRLLGTPTGARAQ
ncbi:MAG: hypothetical protein AAFW84_21315 [Cyanobacteria bacterium J06635_15]